VHAGVLEYVGCGGEFGWVCRDAVEVELRLFDGVLAESLFEESDVRAFIARGDLQECPGLRVADLALGGRFVVEGALEILEC
jgi:hypothetical protein